MKKWISNVFLLGMLFVFATIIPERQTNAAEEYTYYLTINQVYQYEITKEQFESIRGSWDSLTAEGVLEIARQIVPPEQIPSRVTNIGIRAVPKNSAEGTLPVYPFDSEEDSAADNDFVISQGILLRYKGSEEVVTIPENVTSIYQGAFMQNTAVKKVIIPKTVKSIANASFYQCPNLKIIVCAGKAGSVGSYMMYQCNALVNMVAPKGSKEYAYVSFIFSSLFFPLRPCPHSASGFFDMRIYRAMHTPGNCLSLLLFHRRAGFPQFPQGFPQGVMLTLCCPYAARRFS